MTRTDFSLTRLATLSLIWVSEDTAEAAVEPVVAMFTKKQTIMAQKNDAIRNNLP